MSSKADMYGINKSKACADWKKYTSLLQKHVSVLENGNVCFISIGNIDVIFKLLENFKNCKIYIYDNESICKSIELLALVYGFDAGQFTFNCCDDILESIKESTMKFDRIVMNPPYSKNLHLKIFAEAIKHLKDADSTCVNLSPDTWLYPTAEFDKKSDYNKFKNITFNSIERIGLLNQFFDLDHTTYTGAIYVASKNGMFDISTLLCTDILASVSRQFIISKQIVSIIKNKVFKYIATNNKFSTATYVKYGKVDKNTKYTRFIPCLVGNPGERCNCIASIGSKRWDRTFYQGISEGKTIGEYKKKLSNVTNYTNFNYIEFDTESEAFHWRNINTTKFMQLCCLITHRDSNANLHWLPWLGDAVNPRTGLKGYQGEWTDEDLYTFFNINDDEKKVIEETMAKYK